MQVTTQKRSQQSSAGNKPIALALANEAGGTLAFIG
jgi:hypothetical protein